jgi:hypothetical protein
MVLRVAARDQQYASAIAALAFKIDFESLDDPAVRERRDFDMGTFGQLGTGPE